MSEDLEQDRKEERAFWKQLHAAIFEAGGDVSFIGDMKKQMPDLILDAFIRLNISPVYKAADKMLEYHDKWVVADNKIRQLISKIDALEEQNHRLTETIHGLANCKVEDVYDGPKLKLTIQVDARNSYLRKDDPDYWRDIANDMLAKIRKKVRDECPTPAESFPIEPPSASLHADMEGHSDSATYEVKRDPYGKEYYVPSENTTPTNRTKTLREWLDYVIGEYGWSSPAFDYVYDLMDSRGEDGVVHVPDSEMIRLLKSLNAKGKE